MKPYKIEMNIFYSNPQTPVLSGREYGKVCRQKMKLDSIEDKNDKISIVFDDSLFSLNTSFFLGFFGKSITKHGKQGFLEKYEFLGAHDIVSNVIEQGIETALNDKSSLSK